MQNIINVKNFLRFYIVIGLPSQYRFFKKIAPHYKENGCKFTTISKPETCFPRRNRRTLPQYRFTPPRRGYCRKAIPGVTNTPAAF